MKFFVIDFQGNIFYKGKQERVESDLFSTCLHHGKNIEHTWVSKGGVQLPDLNIKVSLAWKPDAPTQAGQVILLTFVLTRLVSNFPTV